MEKRAKNRLGQIGCPSHARRAAHAHKRRSERTEDATDGGERAGVESDGLPLERVRAQGWNNSS